MYNFCANLSHSLRLTVAAGCGFGVRSIDRGYALASAETEIGISKFNTQMHPLASIQSGDLATRGRIFITLG
jgi:hypothetical protein